MSTPYTITSDTAPAADPAVTGVLKLEVVVIPVSDVDRSKRFYEALGWRADADFTNGPDWRAVQMTPPGSPCSIHFGKGITAATLIAGVPPTKIFARNGSPRAIAAAWWTSMPR